ncbi:MAG: hypothetical protein AB1730_02235 [Myxococcota bacterium]
MLDQLQLKNLPSARPVADATPPTKPDVGPAPPDTHIVPPPPPPPVVVQETSVRRPVGYAIAGVGAATAVVGGVLAGIANANFAGVRIQDSIVDRRDVAAYNGIAKQETIGWVLVGAGVAAAGVGLAVALTAPSGPVTVAPVATPGGAGVLIQGRFP